MSNTRSRRRQRQPKRRRGGGRFRTILGILLILVAAGLLLLKPLQDRRIQQGTQANLIGNIDRQTILANQEREASYNMADISNIDAISVLTSNVNPKDLPVIGGIAIPEVDVNLPIYKGATDENMYYGAGTLREDQEMGENNYPLSSHHSKDPNLLFAPLMRVETGDLVYITDLDKIYAYEVDDIFVVTRDRVDVIYPTDEKIITLITCTPDLIDSYIVRGSLVEEINVDQAPAEMLEAFEIPQTIVE